MSTAFPHPLSHHLSTSSFSLTTHPNCKKQQHGDVHTSPIISSYQLYKHMTTSQNLWACMATVLSLLVVLFVPHTHEHLPEVHRAPWLLWQVIGKPQVQSILFMHYQVQLYTWVAIIHIMCSSHTFYIPHYIENSTKLGEYLHCKNGVSSKHQGVKFLHVTLIPRYSNNTPRHEWGTNRAPLVLAVSAPPFQVWKLGVCLYHTGDYTTTMTPATGVLPGFQAFDHLSIHKYTWSVCCNSTWRISYHELSKPN